MICELRIRNLALIDDLTIEFEEGFSVFTGETGAGKSILVGAIGLLLGERASAESIRSGEDNAEVSGVFEMAEIPNALSRILKDNGIEADNNQLIIRRTIARTGRNRIHLNQVPVPVATLKSVGDLLVDLHGQHDHQSLLKQETPLLLIDGIKQVAPSRAAYDQAFAIFAATEARLKDYDRRAAQLAQRRDMIEFQFNELSKLKLAAGEEDDLEQEYKLLSSSSERLERVSEISKLLEGPDGSDSLDRKIGRIRKDLENLAKLDTAAEPWLRDIDNVSTYFSELEGFCSMYLESAGVNAAPRRIEEINTRLAKIQRLKKKYACDFEGLIQKATALKADLDSLENIDADRSLLEKELESARTECAQRADDLTKARKKAAKAFDAEITKRMHPLGFNDGEWETVFAPEKHLSAHGNESVSFKVRTNPGEPFLPLSKTASGGEISRLMLAIKTYLAEKDKIPVLIFDEIDTGIGGMLAKEIGNSLRQLGNTHQVVCVSHFHQIASCAQNHFVVYKTVEAKRTITRIRHLDKSQKVAEIARMLGGETDIARKHAEELLSE